MVEFLAFDLNAHREIFAQLNVEFLTEVADRFREHYQLDAASKVGQTVPQYVNAHLSELSSLRPPEGLIYLLSDEGEIVGMGGIRKLSDEIGEIKRMYIRPPHRGRGYGKLLLSKLLEAGRKLGCSSFRLETSGFMTAAQHIYKSAGFIERDEYPGVETPPILRQQQVFMELAHTQDSTSSIKGRNSDELANRSPEAEGK